MQKKDALNSSQTWAKTEGNEIGVNKMKNKLEEIMNKLKQNFFFKNSKHIKYNSMKLDEVTKNKLKQITKNKTNILAKPLSKKKCSINSDNLGNRTISPKLKNIKKYNSHINKKEEANIKNYSFLKQNKLSKNRNKF